MKHQKLIITSHPLTHDIAVEDGITQITSASEVERTLSCEC